MKIIFKVISKAILYTCTIVATTFNIYISSIIVFIGVASVVYDFYKISSYDYLESK